MTYEQVVTISKSIMPLPADANLQDISTKLAEIGESFKSGKTSIINTLALKNIEASLNNTLVELSEKIKTSFDSSDASVQDLINQLTQANNTISQLNTKYKVASGTTTVLTDTQGTISLYGVEGSYKYRTWNSWIKVNGLNFVPNIFVATKRFKAQSYYYVNIVISFVGVFDEDFSIDSLFGFMSGDTKYKGAGCNVVKINERDAYVNKNGVYLPDSAIGDYTHREWCAIKFK
ncbi:TPA: hypothetical protein MIY49_003984, partial [Clostridioides difficile]|nr:hypothetical protein [Clostridioides difficile]HBZ0309914.1 hypothetical protein [Clostridioides difficile]